MKRPLAGVVMMLMVTPTVAKAETVMIKYRGLSIHPTSSANAINKLGGPRRSVIPVALAYELGFMK